MRWLVPDVIDDRGLLSLVVANTRLKAAPVIRPHEERIAQRYLDYGAAQGDPWVVAQDPTFQAPKKSFHDVYTSPPQDLGFIERFRKSAAGACPMCGSSSNGTLDHYLPKSEYPEYSFFSRNLVPACFRCNNLRRAQYIGPQLHERPLHPYYDAYGAQRLMTAAISPPYDVPIFKAIPWNVPAAATAAVGWHIANIVEPAGFANDCQHMWSRIVDKPDLHLGAVAMVQALRQELTLHSQREEHINHSPNNWQSCFWHGVSQNQAAVEHLVAVLGNALSHRQIDA